MGHFAAKDWIHYFGMEPHPEGGWWAPFYTAADKVMASRYAGDRPACTSIYFLLEKGRVSAAHQLMSDEIWHWYAGDPLELSWINEAGLLVKHKMGPDPLALEGFQVVVPHHSWMAAHSTGAYTLFGCTVAPGFDFADFTLGERSKLLQQYPQHSDWIHRYTGQG